MRNLTHAPSVTKPINQKQLFAGTYDPTRQGDSLNVQSKCVVQLSKIKTPYDTTVSEIHFLVQC